MGNLDASKFFAPALIHFVIPVHSILSIIL